MNAEFHRRLKTNYASFRVRQFVLFYFLYSAIFIGDGCLFFVVSFFSIVHYFKPGECLLVVGDREYNWSLADDEI